ncbi:extracellular solute-binding protein [Sansalvadorimonas sp. 2012CJ34-2]|uniref:Extracellular solute-binding protein n=1 Tax=Parendozoicomonas callyspongiae TaxID=2942213 RepID=A0ABT0PE31_9GAMM|nr:extracellular solute-binding protein [Sansalvadorimonas sp. 2012CJ34-2]MCL6269643.1 extracellular solute-binding protein [Sansalvadorimonas sp. 2012CJ34-2]
MKKTVLALLTATMAFSSVTMASDVKIMTKVSGGKTAGEHKAFVQVIEKNTGMDVSMVKPGGSYDQVVLTTLASGEKYDLIYSTSKQLEYFIKQKAIMPMNDLIAKSPILSDRNRISQEELDVISRDGKIYGIPNKFEGGTMPVVRADWLEELGMKDPATLDQWYNFFKAAKTKYGAYGISTKGLYDIQPFMSAVGVKAGYVMIDGKRTVPYATDAAAPVYDWFAKLYKEGLLDPNFASNSSSDMTKLFLSDQTATVTYWDAFVGLYNNIRTNQDPKTTFRAKGLAGVPGPDGKIMMRRGDSSIWVIPANARKPENAIKFLEFWHSEPGYLLGTLGIEGIDYNVVDGKYVLTETGKEHGLDHGAPRVTSRNWVNPFGSLPGVDEAEAIVLKHASLEVLPAEWSKTKKILQKYAYRAMLGKVTGAEAVKAMRKDLAKSKLID